LDYSLEGKLFNPPSNDKLQIQVIENNPIERVLQHSKGALEGMFHELTKWVFM
jgi:hypothetical protein